MNQTSDNERVVGVLIVMIVAGAILPTAMPALGESLSTWLLAHHVLVEPSQSLVVIPGLAAGLDARRLVIVVLLMVAAAIFAGAARRGSRAAGGQR